MRLMDTHCHLDFDAFDSGRQDLLEQCAQEGIDKLVVPGVGRSNWGACLDLAEHHDSVHAALGMHPYFAGRHTDDDLIALDEALDKHSKHIVALGEMGLDDTMSLFDRQCDLFEAQLRLAKKYALPVIIHMRRNHGHGLVRVRNCLPKGGVVHAFSGSFQDAMSWVDLGISIGVGGIITYDRAKKTRDTISKLPLSSLVLETDAPDMAVQGIKKGQGSPLFLKDVFRALCQLRSESPDEIEQALWQNSLRLFSLSD